MKFREKTESLQGLQRVLSAVGGIFLLILMSHVALAQTFSASISGTVADSSGAAVKGAQLQLVNMATNDTRAQTSSDQGTYTFSNLLPGTYKLSTNAAGFKEWVRADMILRANTAAIVDVQLQVGAAQEQVIVSAGAAVLLDTASANNSITMDRVLLQSLPNNTLQPLNFVYNLAGTTESQGMSTRSSYQDQMTSTFGLNGGRSAESLILIDGAPSTAIDWGGLMVSPMQDSVQEQQVVQNVYDAQYERGGEGVVTMITRGGTSQFHGEIYDFMRNSGLDANSWGNGYYGGTKGKFHRNQFGGNIGGPIWKSHNLFFFAAYEGLRQPGTTSLSAVVPTEAERNGDFSDLRDGDGNLIPIYNPFSTRQLADGSYTRDPFPGNRIPEGMMDATGKAIAALYPKPNHTTGGANFYMQGPDTVAGDKMDWRVDWAKSEKQRLFARMSQRFRQNEDPACFFCNGGDSNANTMNHGVQIVVNDTYTPNASWVIDAYGAYTRWLEGQTLVGYGTSDPSAIGLPKDLFQVPMLPVVNATNYQGMGNPYSSYDRYVRYLSTGLVNVTRQLTRHTVKFGANYDVALFNHREDQPGTFNFTGAMTSCEPQAGGGTCQASNQHGVTGNAIADMLLGTGSGGAPVSMDPAMAAHTFGMYLEDDWRMTQKLTVSAGLRYDNQRPATERYNRIAQFDPKAINPISTQFGSPLYGAFVYAGTGGVPRDAWEDTNTNFGPRLGIAYRLNDKLVVRAGSGIFFGPASAMIGFDDGGQSPGYTAQTNWNGTKDSLGYIPTNLVSNPFPNGMNQPTGNTQGALTDVGQWMSQVWPRQPHPIGTMYQWSLDFQYQVSPHAVAEIGYTGVRGRKLMYGNPNLDLDQLPTQYLAMGDGLDAEIDNPFKGIITDPNSGLSGDKIHAYQMLRPFPEYAEMQATRSLPGARSQFDALDAKYNYSFHNGLSSITTYRWSKALDNGSEALLGWSIGGQWRDYYHTKLDYSLSTHDLPHSFAEAIYYQLPYGTGRRYGATAPTVVRQIIGGWNVSSAIRIASGYPLWTAVNWGWNPLGQYGFPGPAIPNLIGNPSAHRSVKQWINPNAFQGVSSSGDGTLVSCGQDTSCQPFSHSYGNVPQYMGNMREAPTKNVDVGISKEFQMERVNAEIRGDFLNAFNHPIYGGPWNIINQLDNPDWGSLGTVTGTRNDPRNIQVSLKLSF